MKGKLKNFFSRDRKTLYIILSIVLISIFSLTIVYAALSVTLNIQGSAEVVASTWDIHLDNVKVTNGSISGTTPSITTPTTATFSTTLNMPGDFYEFTIDVVNDGSIDAMIDGVSKTPTLTTTQAKYLNYIIEYQNGESINTKQLVSKNSFVRLKVRVEFRKDISASDLPTTSETLNLAFTVNYIQSDGTEKGVTNNGIIYKPMLMSGDLDTIGSEIAIGDEHFYLISSNDDSVTMLAKYNLYVGGVFDVSTNRWTAFGEAATGKQDLNMLGYISGQSIRKGTTKFSNTNYWSSTVSSYPSYVYDSNSTLYNYVENYKTYLSTLGVTPTEARLITYEELTSLGCSGSICKNAPSWVYATTYWSGSAYSSYNVWNVYSYGDFHNNNYSNNNYSGCRPVITISRSLI